MEDAFALRMLQLGARWWPSLSFYLRRSDSQYPPYGYHYPPDRYVGYSSSGGVVVLILFAETSMRFEEYGAPRSPRHGQGWLYAAQWMRDVNCSESSALHHTKI
jgi:hypothetical protein